MSRAAIFALWILVLIFSLFSSLLPFPVGFNGQRWMLVGTTALIVLSYCTARIFRLVCTKPRDPSPRFIPLKIVALLLVFSLLSAFVSFFLSSMPRFSVAQIMLDAFYILAIAYLAALINFVESPSDRLSKVAMQTWFLDSAVLAIFIYAFLGGMGVVFWYAAGVGSFIDYLPWGFYNIRLWSHCATWLLPVVATAIAIRSPLWGKWRYAAALFGLSFWWFLVLGSWARGTALAVLISGLLIWMVVPRDLTRLLFRAQVKAFLGGVVLWGVFIHLIPALLVSDINGGNLIRLGDSGRIDLWRMALDMSMIDFPFGLGPLSYAKLSGDQVFASPHSSVLLWAAEYGWLTVLLFTIAVAAVFQKFFQATRRLTSCHDDNLLLVGLGWSLIAALGHSLVSGVLSAPASMLIGLVCTAFFLASLNNAQTSFNRRASTRVGSVHRPMLAKLIALVACVLAAPLFLSYTYEFWREMRADLPVFLVEKHQPLGPRFWLHGQFPR